MSVELKNYLIAQERIQNYQAQAQQDREVRVANKQNQNARVFSFKLPRLFRLSRKQA